MSQIITNIPFFVWPLFAILLIGGLKATKTSLVPLKVLILIPAIFFSWSLFSFLGRYGRDFFSTTFWIFCLGLGFFIGFSHIQGLKLRFDQQKKKIEMPGSWIPLALSMSIFFAKFSLGMMRELLPHLEGSMLFLGLEFFSSVILGIFVGRSVGCYYKYRSSVDFA